MKRSLLSLLFTLCLSPAVSAAAVWAGGDLTTSGFGVHAGVGLLPVPLLGTLGLEGEWLRAWRMDAGSQATGSLSLGATLHDLRVPLTSTDAFVGAGLRLSGRSDFYAEAGLRTPLIGPAGLRFALRAYPGTGEYRAGAGVELRF